MTKTSAATSPADALLALAVAAMRDELKQARWYQTAPAQFRTSEPEITIVGVENREVYTSIGGGLGGGATHQKPFLIGQVEVGGIRAKLALRLDFGMGGFVVEEGEE